MTEFERVTFMALVGEGLSFRREYEWEQYRMDFAWPEVKVGLEVDGYWHRTPKTAAKDALRDSRMREAGWVILRIDFRTGEENALAQIKRAAEIVRLLKRERITYETWQTQ